MRYHTELCAPFLLSISAVCLALVSCREASDTRAKVVAGLCRPTYTLERPPSSWEKYDFAFATLSTPAEFSWDEASGDRFFPDVLTDGVRSVKARFGRWELGSFDFETGEVVVCFTQTRGSRALVWRNIDHDGITVRAWYLTNKGDLEFFVKMWSPDIGDEELFLQIAQSVVTVNPHNQHSTAYHSP